MKFPPIDIQFDLTNNTTTIAPPEPSVRSDLLVVRYEPAKPKCRTCGRSEMGSGQRLCCGPGRDGHRVKDDDFCSDHSELTNG